MQKQFALIAFACFMTSILFAQSPNFKWAHNMGGQTTNDETGTSIAKDAQGNIYVTGHFSGTGDFDPEIGTTTLTSQGNEDVFIQKFTSTGQLVWATSIGSTGRDMGVDIAIDPSGNIYITGLFFNTVDFDPSAAVYNLTASGNGTIGATFILKLNAAGQMIWAKKIDSSSGNKIAVDLNGDVYVGGSFRNTVDFNPNLGIYSLTAMSPGADAFFLKLTGNGSLVWVNQIGGADQENINDIVVDKIGDVYVTGGFYGTVDFDPGPAIYNLTSTGGADIFLQKLKASNGQLIWGGSTGSTNTDRGNGLAIDAANNIYLTGSFANTVNFNPGGTAINLTAYQSNDPDIFIMKMASNGTVAWAKQIGGPSFQLPSAMDIDDNDNLYITGALDGSADFDPSTSGVYTLASNEFSIFITKLDKNGLFQWAENVGGSTHTFFADSPRDIIIDHKAIYTTGIFSSTEDFNPGSGQANLTSNGSYDAFIMKWDECYAPPFNPDFTQQIICNDNGIFNLQVTGNSQQPAGTNPHSDWYLVEYFPGTSQPEIQRDVISWGQQSNPYVYNANTLQFNYNLQPNKSYYIKHGMYVGNSPGCSTWKEERNYFTTPTSTAAPNPVFNLTKRLDLLNFSFNSYQTCENILLVETYEANNGYNYNGYYIDLWERPCGATTKFNWRSGLGRTYAQLPQALDIKTAFNQQGVVFTAGTEYRVKLAMWNDCDGWEEFTSEFCVTACAVPQPPNDEPTLENLHISIDAKLNIFPNPTSSTLSVEVDDLEIEELHIIDALGRKVANYKNITTIDVQTLETGWYILEAVMEQGVVRKKFIKK